MGQSDITTLPRIDADRIEEFADRWNVPLTEQEREDYTTLVNDSIEGLEDVQESRRPTVGPPRNAYDERPPGAHPSEKTDPLNAWILKCEVPGADEGPLAGKTVGLKDSIALRNYEMTFGSDLLSGFIPEIDATVVTRLLNDGATIIGKTNMESFAWSGAGDLSDFGPVTNPHDDDYLAGGSSSGSAAAAARGDCDIAIGTDVAGSVRIPAAWCGIVGLKPTHGLVPMTGVVPFEHSIDHVGPMAARTKDVGLALDAMAGVDIEDGVKLDPRQPEELPSDTYADAADDPAEDARIGVLDEGFGWELSDAVVDETVRTALSSIDKFGTEDISVPIHRKGIAIWATIATQGGPKLLAEGGVGISHDGWVWERLAKALTPRLRARAQSIPPSTKMSLFTAEFLEDEFGAELYGRARNLTIQARKQFDELLEQYDAVALPTLVTLPLEKAPDLNRPTATSRELVALANTGMFDLTGHPAISVPCGTAEGLPVGLMLVGEEYDEATLLSLSARIETELN